MILLFSSFTLQKDFLTFIFFPDTTVLSVCELIYTHSLKLIINFGSQIISFSLMLLGLSYTNRMSFNVLPRTGHDTIWIRTDF